MRFAIAFVIGGLVAAIGFRNRGVIVETVRRATTTGIRNNNPGNIRRTKIAWRGEVPDSQKTDDEFEQFIGPEWGIRAMVRELRTNQRRGQNTIRQIIAEWAPPNENDTEAYIKSVSKRTGLDPDQAINVELHMADIVNAIIFHENGQNPYSSELVNQGVALA